MLRVSSHRSYKIVAIATLVGVGLAVITLGVLSVLVRYTSFIRAHPWKFVFEVLFSGVLAAFPIFLIAYHRRALYRKTMYDFLILSIKFAVFYVLFELSGINAILFAEHY